MRFLMLSLSLALSSPALAGPKVGEKPPTVKIGGENGGLISGKEWSSDTLKGRIWAVFYVDPDEKDANEALETALADQKFPKEKYASTAIINMDATWLPNAAIASSLESKQEKYPDTVYVKDLKRVLVKEWKMTDDSYDVLVFDKQGKILFAKDGKFAKADIDALIDTIKKNLDQAP